MEVLVVGGTGFIGTAVCETLHERGHAVTALSRSPADAALPAGVTTVSGDATEYAAVESAIEGMDAVINLVALSPLFTPPGELTHHGVHVGATETTLRAATDHDVPRVLQMSALGADPTGETEYTRAKGTAEELVRDSDRDWTIIRPSIVFGDGGEFLPFLKRITPGPIKALPGGGKTRYQPIWVGDLAPMLADAIASDTHSGATYELGGPRIYSLAELTRLVHGGGQVVSVPMGIAKLGLGVAEVLPGIPMGTDQARALEMDNVVEDNDVTAFGYTPEELRTVEAYLN